MKWQTVLNLLITSSLCYICHILSINDCDCSLRSPYSLKIVLRSLICSFLLLHSYVLFSSGVRTFDTDKHLFGQPYFTVDFHSPNKPNNNKMCWEESFSDRALIEWLLFCSWALCISGSHHFNITFTLFVDVTPPFFLLAAVNSAYLYLLGIFQLWIMTYNIKINIFITIIPTKHPNSIAYTREIKPNNVVQASTSQVTKVNYTRTHHSIARCEESMCRVNR